MANVGFKLGSQASVNQLLVTPENIENGSFYLTSDTHRLYIGSLPTETDTSGNVSVTSDSPKLFPLNEGITTVKNIKSLPVFTYGTPEERAAIGNFYYIEEDNILCIYGGTGKDGTVPGWIQVNQNTDTNITGASYTVDADGNGIASITYTIADSSGKNMDSVIKLKVENGITVSADSTTNTITIAGDSYNLNLEKVDETSNNYNINLISENTDNDSTIGIRPGNGIELSHDGNNLQISASNEDAITNVEVNNGYIAESADKDGFRVSITTKKNEVLESSKFNPKIKYGVEEFDTVTFKDGVATLDAYTGAEIKKILRELNAMRYRGTIGKNGSAAALVSKDGNGYHIMKEDQTEVQVQIGDMFICNTDFSVNGALSESYTAGTILICNSKTNAEEANGFISSANLVIEKIDSTKDTDTTYTLSKNSDGNGVILHTANTGDYGELQIIAGENLVAESNWTEPVAGRPLGVITINHENVARADTESKAEESQLTGKEFRIPVFDNIVTDEKGHILSVNKTIYIVRDTISHVDKVENTTSAYQKIDNEKGLVNVGAVNIAVTTKTDAGAELQKDDTFIISSSTLQVIKDDSNAATEGGTVKQHGLSINMVWGEF